MAGSGWLSQQQSSYFEGFCTECDEVAPNLHCMSTKGLWVCF